MKTIDCSKAETWILTEMDEGLSERDSLALEDHLVGCENCRAARKEMSELLSIVAEDVPGDPGEFFWNNYDSSLEARIREKSSDKKSVWWWKPAGAVLAAALAMIIVNVYPIDSPRNTLKDPEQMTAVVEDLYMLFGPVDQDWSTEGGAVQGVVASVESYGTDDEPIVTPWFEAEDELNHLL